MKFLLAHIARISAPAAYPDVISVGATWGGLMSTHGEASMLTLSANADSIVHFSQRDDQLLDVVAFGGGITSAKLGGGSTVMSGTSMAAPYVTGLILLMQEAAELELGRKLSKTLSILIRIKIMTVMMKIMQYRSQATHLTMKQVSINGFSRFLI